MAKARRILERAKSGSPEEIHAGNVHVNFVMGQIKLTFILNQILSNSVKYCQGGDSWIHIYAESIKDGVVLWIDDNGKGIKPEDLPRMTEKGFTGSERKKSTGLGLYLAKRLTVQLGLAMDVFSFYGEGTRVRIIFPVGSLHQLDLQFLCAYVNAGVMIQFILAALGMFGGVYILYFGVIYVGYRKFGTEDF